MAHHKRRRPKNRRSGCLLCKPHKANGIKKRKFVSASGVPTRCDLARTWKQEARGQIAEREQKDELGIR